MRTLVEEFGTPVGRAEPWSRDIDTANLVTNGGGLWTAGEETTPWRALLDHYLEGWVEANPFKIIAATEPGYQFNDPLVGLFTRESLSQYFELLQAKFASAGAITRGEFAFYLRRPTNGWSSRLDQQFWREAPRIGLTGISEIKVGKRGVIAETVAYDLNLASDVLHRALPSRLPFLEDRACF
jgi:hypothetical protein